MIHNNEINPDIYNDVLEFFQLAQSELIGIPFRRSKGLELGKRLIEEEVVKELLGNLEKLINNWSVETAAAVMDDCVDSIYVIIWLMIAMDLPFKKHWKVIAGANVAKFPKHTCELDVGPCEYKAKLERVVDEQIVLCEEKCVNGRLVTRNSQTGKVIKPIGWTPVNNFEVLYSYWHQKISAEQDKREKTPNTLRKEEFQQDDYKPRDKLEKEIQHESDGKNTF